jgi:flagellar FliL protein
MADEEIEVEGKKKSPLIKIIVIALVAILLLVGTVVGTLFVTGFFDKKDTVAAEEALKNLENSAANKAELAFLPHERILGVQVDLATLAILCLH